MLLTAVADAHRTRSQRAPRQSRPQQYGAAGGGTDTSSSKTLGLPHTQRHPHPARLALTQEFAEAQQREGRQRGGGRGGGTRADECTRSFESAGDIYVSLFCYICVLILLYMCPHSAIYVSSYCHIYAQTSSPAAKRQRRTPSEREREAFSVFSPGSIDKAFRQLDAAATTTTLHHAPAAAAAAVFSPLTRGSTSKIDQAFRQVLH